MKAEHEKEGIGKVDNCVRCHRSAKDEPVEGEERNDRGEGRDD